MATAFSGRLGQRPGCNVEGVAVLSMKTLPTPFTFDVEMSIVNGQMSTVLEITENMVSVLLMTTILFYSSIDQLAWLQVFLCLQ
jgi:hypothetical protein